MVSRQSNHFRVSAILPHRDVILQVLPRSKFRAVLDWNPHRVI